MADRGAAARAVELLAADPYARLLGIELAGAQPVAVTMEITGQVCNFLGAAHGGAVFSLADCALSLASNLPGGQAVAIDTHLALTAPGRLGDRLTAQAEEISRGRTLATYRVTVHRQDQRVVGVFTGTVLLDDASGRRS